MAFEDKRNNPGNLKFANQPGAIGKDEKGFAIFPDQETGMKAMRRQLELDLIQRGKTGREFLNKYAPPSENPTDAYIKNVFGELKIDPDKKVDPVKLDDIQRLMVRQEKGVAGMQHYYANRQDTEKGRILASTPTAPESTPTKSIASTIDSVKSKAMRVALAAATKRMMANMKNAPSAAEVNKFYSNIGLGSNVIAENAKRFKDLRKTIQENIILNDQIENSEE